MEYRLAIDIGASSGRCMIGYIENQQLIVKEMHRFSNGIVEKHGHSCWDIEQLYQEIVYGLKRCKREHMVPTSLSIDTWSCDYVLLDELDCVVGDAIAYRDARCDGVMEQAFTNMDKNSIYERTGIQFQKFNTLYQLLAQQKEDSHSFISARSFLMIPDYLHYRLTGIKSNEYSNASSTQLMNAKTKDWDDVILQRFGLARTLFQKLYQPGERIGSLLPQVSEEVGFSCDVIACATHDTGSAFVLHDCTKQILISSGTWSLVGVLNDEAICSKEAQVANFTNEGGFHNKIRFLKNIMGLWIIQEVQRVYKGVYSFEQFVHEARQARYFPSIIDVNDDRFLHPSNMVDEIQSYCQEHQMQIPQRVGEIAYCIYHSLAISYQSTIQELEKITKKHYESIHIFGGGSQNELLNEMVSKVCNKRVYAGPSEATAMGNLLVQMQSKEPLDIDGIIQTSCNISCYEGGKKL